MSLSKEVIRVGAGAGQDITSAIVEALKLSLEQRCPIVLIHNDREVHLNAQPVIEAAWKEWNSQR